MTADRLCSRCGSRPARYYPITILGSLTLSKHQHCAECTRELDAESEGHPPPAEDDFAHLGPIQFDTLREAVASAEVHDAPEMLPGYEPLVRQIAAAHNQVIPPDIEAVFQRWRAQ